MNQFRSPKRRKPHSQAKRIAARLAARHAIRAEDKPGKSPPTEARLRRMGLK